MMDGMFGFFVRFPEDKQAKRREAAPAQHCQSAQALR
jgi:hypothetical protein